MVMVPLMYPLYLWTPSMDPLYGWYSKGLEGDTLCTLCTLFSLHSTPLPSLSPSPSPSLLPSPRHGPRRSQPLRPSIQDTALMNAASEGHVDIVG